MLPALLLRRARPALRAAQPALRAHNTTVANGTERPTLTLQDHVYCIRATAEGAGRNGHVFAGGDAPLDMHMSVPKSMGGKGDGPNPEQLFAMGYASCFLAALQLAASRAGKKELADNARVHAAVRLGHPTDRDGFGLNVNIDVEGVDDDTVIASAHENCPYSRALVHGAQVTVLKKTPEAES